MTLEGFTSRRSIVRWSRYLWRHTPATIWMLNAGVARDGGCFASGEPAPTPVRAAIGRESQGQHPIDDQISPCAESPGDA